RDAWAYNFNSCSLETNIKHIIEVYNEQVFKWHRQRNKPLSIDDFVTYDDTKISWSGDLKEHLLKMVTIDYEEARIRRSLYRPFTSSFLYFDAHLNNSRYLFPYIFPNSETEAENQAFCVGGYGRKAFAVLVSNCIPDLNFYADPQQSFPFYTYNEDGSNRRENITDWALDEFRAHYKDNAITKWNIFHYVYAVLHHPTY